jgi:hypothetical protein
MRNQRAIQRSDLGRVFAGADSDAYPHTNSDSYSSAYSPACAHAVGVQNRRCMQRRYAQLCDRQRCLFKSRRSVVLALQ